jgi:hypothetical protein
MPLKADQRAMLQLLLERGQSYDDIASVLGVGRDEVRQRARTALTELAGSDPDAEVDLTDYLLGQADPIGRADAVRHLQNDPGALQLASDLEAQLQLLAPEAELPELPAPRGRRRGEKRATPPAAGPGPTPAPPGGEAAPESESVAARLRGTLSVRQQQVIVAAGVLILIAAILAVTGAFSGGEGTPAPSAPAATEQGHVVTPVPVNEKGEFSGEFPLSPIAVALLGQSEFVDVSLSSIDALTPALEEAVSESTPLLDYEGTSVLRGEVARGVTSGSGSDGRVVVPLKAEDGQASGQVSVGVKNESEAVINVEVRNMPAPGQGEAYFVWFILPEDFTLPEPNVPSDQGGGGAGNAGE